MAAMSMRFIFLKQNYENPDAPFFKLQIRIECGHTRQTESEERKRDRVTEREERWRRNRRECRGMGHVFRPNMLKEKQ